MKCPLTQAEDYWDGKEWQVILSDCLKEECAWWDRQTDMCIWLCQGRALALILTRLTEIEAKMPYKREI